MTNTKLRQKINEILYPDKADMLVFGCEWETHMYSGKINDDSIWFDKKNNVMHIDSNSETDAKSFDINTVAVFNILGLPIMLGEILMALNKIKVSYYLGLNEVNGVSVFSNEIGVFIIPLGKELEQYSEETIKQLEKIFNV